MMIDLNKLPKALDELLHFHFKLREDMIPCYGLEGEVMRQEAMQGVGGFLEDVFGEDFEEKCRERKISQ